MQEKEHLAGTQRKSGSADTTTDHSAANATPKGEGDGGADSPKEIGGRNGPDPTRYGDWEKNGRCIDF